MTSFKSSQSTKKPEPRFLRNLNSYYRAIRTHMSPLSTCWHLGGRKGRTGGLEAREAELQRGLAGDRLESQHTRVCLPKGRVLLCLSPLNLHDSKQIHSLCWILSGPMTWSNWVSIITSRGQTSETWVKCQYLHPQPYPLPTHHHRTDATQLSKPEPLDNRLWIILWQKEAEA